LKKKQEKRLFYYAAVIKANDHMMPVAEFISTNQLTNAISNWLYSFKLFATERSFDLSDLIANVTSDLSTAIIKSLAQAFNECKDVINYLDQCYDYLYVNKPMKSKIILNLCCCHLVKNISDDVFKYYGAVGKTNKNKDLARIIVGFVTPAFDLKMVNDLDKWFTVLYTVILSPYQNGDIQKFIDFLIELNNSGMTVLNSKEYKHTSIENILFLNSDGTQVDDLKINPLSKGKYKASKFYGRFAKISRDIRASITLDNEGVANEFYNEEYFSDFMGSVVPVIPMWTCLMIYLKTEVCHRPNNSGAELWFHYLKGNSLQAKSMKCSRFIRLNRDRIESVAKEVLCNIPNTRCAIPKKQNVNCDIVQKNKSVLLVKIVTDLSDDEVTEQWKPRKNKKNGYFMQGSLMANMKKFKPNQVIHEKTEIVDLTTISDENKQIIKNNMVTPRAVQTVKTFSTPSSYSSPIDKTQLQYDVYPNRLKKDIHFYRQWSEIMTKDKLDYIVGIYKHAENTVVYSEILFSDFDILSDYRSEGPYAVKKMWLTNFLTSIILASYSVKYSKKSNTQIYRADLVDSIIEKHKYTGKVNIKEKSFLVMPWNLGGSHWIIAFADFCKKECYIMDPMGHQSNEQERFSKFIKRLKLYCSYGEQKSFPKLKLITNKLHNVLLQKIHITVECIHYITPLR